MIYNLWMRRRNWLLVVLSLLGSPALAEEAPSPRRYIYLQPLGPELPQADVQLVEEALTLLYGAPLKQLPRATLPSAAYYPARKRYRADRLLDFLRDRLPADGVRILGFTAVDISTTKGQYADWGVLGLGSLDGAAGVISTFRCHRGATGPLHARQRLAKVAVHEVGHTLGLPHCPTIGCLMEDAQGKVATTDREYDLCPRCRAQLRQRGLSLPPAPAVFPWPRPAGAPAAPAVR